MPARAATTAAAGARSAGLRTAADLLRAAGAGSVAWAVVDGQWVDAALFALTLGGLMLPRILAVVPALDLLYAVVVLFAAWSAVLDLYVTYDRLDVVVHTVACGLVTGTVHRLLVTRSVLPSPGDRVLRRAAVGVVVTVVALGLALGVLWEVGEWLGHTYLDQRIQVGYDDTMSDLVSDGLGALAAGLLVLRIARPGSR
jgi:hypothetical protein